MMSEVQDTLLSIFRTGTRYQTEKVAVLVAFVLLSAASLAWAFSGESEENELGAEFGRAKVEQLDQDVFYLMNTSDDDWSKVRLVINFRYLFKKDTMKSQDRKTLSPDDFAYFYYIPRTWGASSWERLAKEKKPGEHAPSSMVPEVVQLRAEQGKLDMKLGASAQKAQ